MEAVVEGLLFLAGDEGISFKKLVDTLEIDENNLNKILCELENKYKKEISGITIEMLGTKIKLTTKKEHNVYYEKFFSFDEDSTLSPSALEVLAIIAYNDPITRGEVDEIRGVSSSYIIRKLLGKNLVESKGKSELPGRPNLYGVTDRFLDYFGLGSTDELPVIEEKIEETEEKDLYNSKYVEK